MLRTYCLNTCIASLGLVLIWLNSASFVWLLAGELSDAAYDPLVAVNQADATLRSVSAITVDKVVAVGDRGLVLTTADGGVSWTRQRSGTTANLHAVEFVDSQRGWAVGGTVQARSKTSVGIVLATTDGGATWHFRSAGDLPRLTGVVISTDCRLVAWGDYAPHYRSSVFESLDGGTSWRGILLPMGHAQTVGWALGGVGLTLDRLGGSCLISSQTSTETNTTFEPSRPVYAVAHTGKHWLACGAGGQLLSSNDGKVWQNIPPLLSESACRVCEWYSIAQRENQVWIAGYPGSVLLQSSDYGYSWDKATNNYSLPKFDLSFADKNRGWAVGPGGSILATRDGGKTWFAQRSNWQRLSMQAIVSCVSDLPWPALVSASWDDRRASAGLVVHAGNLEQSSDFLPEESTIAVELAPQVGIADLRVLPNYPRTKLLAADDSWLVDVLATAIRVWRPDVVITENPAAKQAVQNTTARLVQRAIQIAAAPNEEQARVATELNLQAWRVKKTVVASEKSGANFTILRDQVLRDAGIAISDVLLPLGELASSENSELSMRTLDDWAVTAAQQSSLLGGIAPSDENHRRLSLKNVGNYQFVMARVFREASIKRLQQLKDLGPSDLHVWQSHLEFLLKNLPKREVGPTLIRIAEESLRNQQFSRWKAALELLADSSPSDDATRWSRLQLSNLTASDEMHAWQRSCRAEQSPPAELQFINDFPTNLSVGQASWSETPFESAVIPAVASVPRSDSTSLEAARFDVAIASVSTVATPDDEYVANLRTSLERFQTIASTDTALSSRPDQLLVHQSRLRRFFETTDSPATLSSNLQLVATQTKLAGWKEAADQELHLLSGRIDSIRQVAHAAKTDHPPHLDGNLDEEFWQRAQPIDLSNSSGSSSPAASQIRFAHDDRYLYISAVCPRAKQTHSEKSPSTRQYDMNLVGTDHLHFLLDTDRDYATAHELGINHRGETFDRSCGFAEWNPKWFVAVRETDQLWLTEAAIELDDLTLMSDVGRRAWAISAYRYVPDSGDQSWSQMKSAQPLLQASGLLLLEP